LQKLQQLLKKGDLTEARKLICATQVQVEQEKAQREFEELMAMINDPDSEIDPAQLHKQFLKMKKVLGNSGTDMQMRLLSKQIALVEAQIADPTTDSKTFKEALRAEAEKMAKTNAAQLQETAMAELEDLIAEGADPELIALQMKKIKKLAGSEDIELLADLDAFIGEDGKVNVEVLEKIKTRIFKYLKQI
jgi:hypothetical protein